MIKFSDFILKQEYFNKPSMLHGIGHTYRVMALAWELGNRLNMARERDLAFMAAFIHDMARNHDGVCWKHGKRAVKYKLPVFREFFIEQGATENDMHEISFSVHYHCTPREPEKKHPFYPTLALLKDADALDRIRMGPSNLNPRWLRYDESRRMIKEAEELYFKSLQMKHVSVEPLIKIMTQ
jgi:HD superfamily phosphodiesterase